MSESEKNRHSSNSTPPQSTIATTPQAEEVRLSEEHKDKDSEPYSIYTRREKWFIVLLIAVSGLFSPLTTNVYFPAIPTMADAFHKSTELINLTVTMYMIFQGISPMLFGTLADNVGRRIIYASCLLILALTCVGLALTPTSAYWLLLVLRCLQSTGSASTIALGAGVIGDISEAHERGGFFGVYQSGPLLAPAIGPVIGGALTGSLGWRSIFWFLCISAGIAFLVVITFLPETLRSIVGNGNIKTSAIHRPLIRVVGRSRAGTKPPLGERQRKGFQNPFRLLKNIDLVLILSLNGFVCAVYYAVTATISTIFAEAYPFLDETQVGLCFLSIGGGMFAGSLSSGRLLDMEFRKVQKQVERRRATSKGNDVTQKTGKYDADFPIEKARLRLVPYYMLFFVGSCIGYGWCIQQRVHISGPLILQFVVGFTSILVMNTSGTLVLDLIPSQSSSVSACNNLFRGSMGAALVSVIDLISRALRPGWTFLLLGCVCAALTPFAFVVMKIGPRCRERRLKQQH